MGWIATTDKANRVAGHQFENIFIDLALAPIVQARLEPERRNSG